MTRFVESTITFPYKRSLGPGGRAFMTALTERRILGHPQRRRRPRARRWSGIRPPAPSSPTTSSRSARRARSSRGRGCRTPSEQHPLDHPFAFAFIRLDGATTPLLHAVDAGAPDAMADGHAGGAAMEGHPGRAHRRHRRASCPARTPEIDGDDAGPAAEPVDTDGLPRVDHLPEPGAGRRPTAWSRRRASTGCSGSGARCARASTPAGDGYCPIDAVALGPEHEVDLPQTGHDHQLRDRHPGAVPGPDRDRAVRAGLRAARRHRRHPPLPAGDRPAGRRGARRQRVAAVWAVAGAGDDDDRRRHGRLVRATCSAGCPTANPTSTTPTS